MHHLGSSSVSSRPLERNATPESETNQQLPACSGGPGFIIDEVLKIGLKAWNNTLGAGSIGSMAEDLANIIGFVAAPNNVGISIYDCIGGYAEGGGDSKLDAATLRTSIGQKVVAIKTDIDDFLDWYNKAQTNSSYDQQEYQDGIRSAFTKAVNDTADLASNFRLLRYSAQQRASALLTTFTTFTTTQHMPILKMRFDNAELIYGPAFNNNASLSLYRAESTDAIQRANMFVDNLIKNLVNDRLRNVTKISSKFIYYGSYYYSFNDTTTGQVSFPPI